MQTRALLLAALAVSLSPAPLQAQTIYPIDRAEILSGAKFDLKIEFPAGATLESVTVNGAVAESLSSNASKVIDREDGSDHSAYWLRDVSLPAPGAYEVLAKTSSGTARVNWTVFGTPERKARNVILFIGDGMSMAHRTAARILSKGIVEGKYGGELAIDDMPQMALVSTAGSDSIVTDSANSMSAYTTGHKTCVNAMGVYCALNESPFAHPKVENLTSLVQRRQKMAVGIVTNSELSDATPAAMVAQTRRRAEKAAIVRMFFDAKPDVLMGGGSAYFTPFGTPGSLRKDNQDFATKFKEAGYAYAATSLELKSVSQNADAKKLLGLFNSGDVDGALDLKFLKKGTVADFPDQPDLVEQTKAALDVLERAPNGFLLMVESARIDKYSHSLDWERAVYDTIMLDNAVKTAKDYAAKRNDTLIIVVADHGHPVSLAGTYDDERPGNSSRAKLGVYADAKFPNYPPADPSGYPPAIDVSRRLALLFSAFPDHCFSGKPFLSGEFKPTQKAANDTFAANDAFCKDGAERREGNLPIEAGSGVHSGDDVVLTAIGPGAERFHGRIDNTFVFRAISEALGLGEKN